MTRSMLQIMVSLASQVTVPPQHLAEGRTTPALDNSEDFKDDLAQFMRINSSAEKPEDAYTAVAYKDYWFWVDDRDFKSKRAFTFLMILLFTD